MELLLLLVLPRPPYKTYEKMANGSLEIPIYMKYIKINSNIVSLNLPIYIDPVEYLKQRA